MADIQDLRRIAELLRVPAAFQDIRGEALDEGMQDADGLSYFPLPFDGWIIQTHVNPHLAEPVTEDTEISFVIFEETQSAHSHGESDGVILVMSEIGDSRLDWERLVGGSDWRQLSDGEVLELPRGTVHGLRPMKDAKPLYAITVNNPPLRDDDITRAKA